MWWVLGTLGSFLKAAFRSAESLVYRLLPALLSPRADADAGTDCPAAISLGASDREGFDDE